MKSIPTSAVLKHPHAAPSKRVASLFTRNREKGLPTIRATKPVGKAPLQVIWRLIVTNAFRRLTHQLRTVKRLQNFYKANLPAVTPAATFMYRNTEGVLLRSGWLVLDFDDVSPPELPKLRKVLRKDSILGPSILLDYISPRAAGLKVWVRIDLQFEHGQCFDAVLAHLRKEHPVWAEKVDPSGRDITRLCFLCHDPTAYLNPHHETAPAFPMSGVNWQDVFDDTGDRQTLGTTSEVDLVELERCVSAAEQVPGFADSYEVWNKLSFAFASLGEAGRDFFHRVSRTSTKYNQKENDKKFDSVLKNSKGKITIKTFFYLCKQADITLPAAPADPVKMPLFKEGLYARLPDFLRRCCAPFDGIERDVMLLGTLDVLSGCFPGVGGVYNRRTCSLNLYVFIVGPAASGKGPLVWARYLVEPWDERLIDASNDYQAQLSEYEKAADPTQPRPQAPAYHQLLIPGNITAAALLTCLAANRGHGIICETEADTVSGQMSSDFGNFSDVFRKAFHGEPVSVMRKTNREHLRVKRPALSIALTGSPDQARRLFTSAEDGLVSRFLFKVIDPGYEWKDVGPGAGSPLDPYMDKLATELTGMLAAMPTPSAAGEYLTQVTLSAADWQRINEAGQAVLDESLAAHGSQGASTAYRLGLIAWRIAAILTVLRCFERGEIPGQVVEADSVDVSTALSLIQTARRHAMTVLSNLAQPKGFKSGKHATKADQVAKARALREKGLSWRDIGRQLGVPFNTIRRWLTEEE